MSEKIQKSLEKFAPFDIRKHISEWFMRTKPREPHLKKMHLRADKISNFINGYGGMSVSDFARFAAVAGWKVIDSKGNTIIGNDPDQEVAQNLLGKE